MYIEAEINLGDFLLHIKQILVAVGKNDPITPEMLEKELLSKKVHATRGEILRAINTLVVENFLTSKEDLSSGTSTYFLK